MTFAYDPTLFTPIDSMRQALWDIVAPGIAPDETYEAQLLEMGGNWRRAAAALARSFAAAAIREPTSLSGGSKSIGYTTPARDWLALAVALEQQASAAETPVAGNTRLYVTLPSRADIIEPTGEYSNGLRG